MLRLFHDGTSDGRGIPEPAHGGDCPRAQAGTLHDRRVKLHAAVFVEEAAGTGVEGGIIFEHSKGRDDDIERPRPGQESLHARSVGPADSVDVRLLELPRDAPCAAVDLHHEARVGRVGLAVREHRHRPVSERITATSSGRYGVPSPWKMS